MGMVITALLVLQTNWYCSKCMVGTNSALDTIILPAGPIKYNRKFLRSLMCVIVDESMVKDVFCVVRSNNSNNYLSH